MEDFQIISKLGTQKHRKFGDTYLVKQNKSDELFVLKQVDKIVAKPQICQRFRLEKDFSFDFEGLPRMIRHEETNQHIRNIFEYHKGETLDIFWEKLKRRDKLQFTKDFIQKLTPILNHLEDQNIVHCDLKPTNIIVEGKLDDFKLHLIDFGLAINTSNTEQRKILFPLGYAAPELLLNELNIVDSRSDLFSLGILIWRLFTDELPLRHPNPSIFTNLQLTHPLPNHNELPKGLFEILAKMTSKHQFKLPPNKMKHDDVVELLTKGMASRYNSIQEVSDDLNQLKARKSFYQRISFR